MYSSFFNDLNKKLFNALNELEKQNIQTSGDKITPKQALLGNDMIRKMDLDPTDDRDFLSALIRLHNFDIKLN